MIIGVCGFIGSGKDTFAEYCIKNHNFIRFSFGDAVKDVISNIFGWERRLLQGDSSESRDFRNKVDHFWSSELNIPNFTPRIAMQLIATDLLRDKFNSDIWVKIIKRQIIVNKDKNIIISDCRFPNEIEMIKNFGGILVYVNRNKPIWFDKYKSGKDVEEISNIHPSETSWIRCQFDYELDNNGSLDDYLDNIKIFLNNYFN